MEDLLEIVNQKEPGSKEIQLCRFVVFAYGLTLFKLLNVLTYTYMLEIKHCKNYSILSCISSS